MGHGHGVGDLGTGKAGIYGDPEAHLRGLVQGQHAAIGGIGTGADAETHGRTGELGRIVTAGIGPRLPGRGVDAQAIVAMDTQGTRYVSGASGDGVGRHDADGAIPPGVLEPDGVLQLLTGHHVGGAGATDIGDRLVQRGQQIGAVQVADEHQRVREVDVAGGRELQIGRGAAVRHARAGVGRHI